MEYVKQSLSPGEEIVYVGQFHWFYTLHAVMSIVMGLVGCIVVLMIASYVESRYGHTIDVGDGWLSEVRSLHPGIKAGALVVFVLGFAHFSHMMMVRASTEIAVTTSRVIYKRGIIARYIGEMSIDRIEGVNVLQTIPGRIFGYGRILVRGMGIGEVILPPLANPIAFRKAIERARTI